MKKKTIKKYKGKPSKSKNKSKKGSMMKMKKKCTKSFHNLNSKNLVPKVDPRAPNDRHKRTKNYLYENDRNYAIKLRTNNSIYQKRKNKESFNLVTESVNRRKQQPFKDIKGSNTRKLKNLMRDKSHRMMEDYSNKNIGIKRKKETLVNKETIAHKEDYVTEIETKLKLLKTKLVQKSYEESKTKTQKSKEPDQSVQLMVSEIEPEETIETPAKLKDSKILQVPFNSITMREVTPRFQPDSEDKSRVLTNSSILKKRTVNFFESDYYESTEKKVDQARFNLKDFINRLDPDNVFSSQNHSIFPETNLKDYDMKEVHTSTNLNLDEVANLPELRSKVLFKLREQYSYIMNN